MMTDTSIDTAEKLRALFPNPPSPLAVKSVRARLEDHHRAFIALSPLVMIGSADAHGQPDVSPRGDLPGFVRVLDAQTLLLPERPGNRKLLTMSNLIENRAVLLLFLIPGRDETLRITGTAQITADGELLGPSTVQGHLPLTGLLVTVDQVWLHCGKALIRSRVWDPSTHPAPDALPSLGRMLADLVDGVDPDEADAQVERTNRTRLWGEPGV